MWRVTATDREGREVARVDIEAGELSIGRDADRQMILASPSVSRRHCRLRVDGNGPVIVDEGSANGVIVNGVRISGPTAVNQMSRIEVAEFRISVEPFGPQRPVAVAAPDPSMSAMGPMAGAPMAMPMPGPGVAPPALPQDMVRLIAEGGPYEGRIFDLPPLQEIAVGRAVDNDLVLDDPSLSRKHAKLRRLGGGRLDVADVNSANGTYVNGRKVDRAQLGPGDTLRFGELIFRLDGGGMMPRAAGAALPAAAAAPKTVQIAFFGLAALTGVVWVFWLLRVLSGPPAPPRGTLEKAIAERIHSAEAIVGNAKEEYEKGDWARAKSLAQQALDIDPASLEAARLQTRAGRAEDDENSFNKASSELGRGTPDGVQSALHLFQSMSPDSIYRQKLAEPLSAKLLDNGMALCRQKNFKDCASRLCESYQVGPQKPGPTVMNRLRDAEKRARMITGCTLR